MNMDILSIKNYIELLNHKKNYNIEHSFFDILVVLFCAWSPVRSLCYCIIFF